nr:trafficking protein particle complex subunit 4-like [Ciona intestinalis]|eukprot:XP_002126416.1 trafficking protein particle complex subunit 4-like [Ciona intestinalis]
MTVFSVYVVNKAGGLVFQYDHQKTSIELEKTFSYPLDLKLEPQTDYVTVVFGQQDGIKVGHVILSVNGKPANGRKLQDGSDVMEFIENEKNYPLNIRFGRPKLSSNQKIMMASMFHSLYAISVQLSPESGSSGIQKLETDTFTLHCHQTVTGVKFIVISDPKQVGVDSLLARLYTIYSDYALKNPFYSLEMPIRTELFDSQVVAAIEQTEKVGSAI